MSKIYSWNNRPPLILLRFPDRRVRNEYVEYIDENGYPRLKVSGTYDAYEDTQLFKDSVDIYHILDRCKVKDYSGVQARPVTYADVSGMPHDISGAVDIMRHAREIFDSLDTAIKKKYGNDFSVFMANFEKDVKFSVPAPAPQEPISNGSGEVNEA